MFLTERHIVKNNKELDRLCFNSINNVKHKNLNY